MTEVEDDEAAEEKSAIAMILGEVRVPEDHFQGADALLKMTGGRIECLAQKCCGNAEMSMVANVCMDR